MANISDKDSEQLKNLTQSEAWELIRQIELKFGVRPAAPWEGVVYSAGHGFPTPLGITGRKVFYSVGQAFGGADVAGRRFVFVKGGVTKVDTEAATILENVGIKVTVSEAEASSLTEESIIELFSLDGSETLIREIDNLLDDISGADERIKTNQASIDSLKKETKEMLATLHAMVD
jgi:hypothetical protein